MKLKQPHQASATLHYLKKKGLAALHHINGNVYWTVPDVTLEEAQATLEELFAQIEATAKPVTKPRPARALEVPAATELKLEAADVAPEKQVLKLERAASAHIGVDMASKVDRVAAFAQSNNSATVKAINTKPDQELEAIQICFKNLEQLVPDGRTRALRYLNERFGADD